MPLFASIAFLFLLGIIFGSYATMLLHRIAHGEGGKVTGRSHCPGCHHTLSWMDLFPLFSWIALGGKCRYCQKKIPARYPLIEGVMGVVFVALGMKFFVFSEILSGNMVHIFSGIFVLFIGFISVAVSAYDLEHMLIPGTVLFPGIFVAIIARIVQYFWGDFLPWNVASGWTSLTEAFWGGGLLFALIGGQAYLSREKIMGKGDGDIALFMGIILGWKLALVSFLCTYLVGGLIGIVQIASGKRGEVPFGPYLFTGLMITLLWGSEIFIHYQESVGIL